MKHICLLILLNISIQVCCPLHAQDRDFKLVTKWCEECSVGNAKSCLELEKMALNHDNRHLRIRAVSCIYKPEILVQIAVKDKEWMVREAAVKKIEDQNTLIFIARNDGDLSVRKEAILKLTDQTVLIDIAKNGYFNDRPVATTLITNQDVLEDLALNDEYFVVRKEAVHKLNNQKILGEIAKNDQEKQVREAATEKLENQELLIDIAFNDKDEYVRGDAVSRIENQKILQDIYYNKNESEIVHTAAIKGLKNNKLLKAIVLNETESENNQMEALKRIDNDSILSELYKKISDKQIFRLIILTSDPNLKKYYNNLKIKTESYKRSQNYAGSNVLVSIDYKVIVSDNERSIFIKTYRAARGGSVEYFIDNKKEYHADINLNEICDTLLYPFSQDDLKLLILNSGIYHLRIAALNRLQDLDFIYHIAQHDLDINTRLVSIGKLTDREKLNQIMTNEPDMKIQEAIKKRLFELNK
jgi:hypothetical protein